MLGHLIASALGVLFGLQLCFGNATVSAILAVLHGLAGLVLIYALLHCRAHGVGEGSRGAVITAAVLILSAAMGAFAAIR